MRAWGWSFLFVVACQPDRPLDLPEDPGAKSMILVLPERGAVYGISLPVAGHLLPLALNDDTALYARTFDSTLAELGLEDGKPGIFQAGPDTQPVYPGRHSYESSTGRERAWQTLDTNQAEAKFSNVFLPKIAGDCCDVTVGGEPRCAFACVLPVAPVAPSAPSDPVLPALEPCPPTWIAMSSTMSADLMHCEPPRLDCSANTWRFPGDAACGLDECPADGWPVDAPPGAIYVDAAATPPGDGSRSAPYATLTTAISAAPDGATLALRVGTHQNVILERNVDLLGACRSGTHLSSAIARSPIVRVASGTSHVSQLSIAASRFDAALLVQSAATAVLEDVELNDGAGTNTVLETGATLEAHRVSWLGFEALEVRSGATASLSASRIRGGRGSNCLDGAAARINLADVDIGGCGLAGIYAAHVELDAQRLVIHDALLEGIRSVGSTITLSQAAIFDARNGYSADGLPSLVADHLWIARTTSYGFHHVGGSVMLTDVVVEEGGPKALSTERASLIAQRVAVIQPSSSGFEALTGDFQIEDLTVRRFDGVGSVAGIQGAYLSGAGRLDRALLIGSLGTGINVSGVSTSENRIGISDLTVAGFPSDSHSNGTAVSIVSAKVDLERLYVRDWRGTRMRTSGGLVVAHDIDLAGTGVEGASIHQTDFTLERGRIAGHTGFGFGYGPLAIGAAGRVIVSQLEVIDGEGATGVAVEGLAAGDYSLRLDAFSIHGAGGQVLGDIGIAIDPVFDVALKNGVISDHHTGIQVYEPSFPLEQLEDRVYFLGVEQLLEDVCLSPPCG